jgi:hypothetical protein
MNVAFVGIAGATTNSKNCSSGSYMTGAGTSSYGVLFNIIDLMMLTKDLTTINTAMSLLRKLTFPTGYRYLCLHFVPAWMVQDTQQRYRWSALNKCTNQ